MAEQGAVVCPDRLQMTQASVHIGGDEFVKPMIYTGEPFTIHKGDMVGWRQYGPTSIVLIKNGVDTATIWNLEK